MRIDGANTVDICEILDPGGFGGSRLLMETIVMHSAAPNVLDDTSMRYFDYCQYDLALHQRMIVSG